MGRRDLRFHSADRANNGRLEGTNANLGVLKRIAYGFVNATNFAKGPPQNKIRGVVWWCGDHRDGFGRVFGDDSAASG